jgi:hypothetical protein
MIIRRYLSFVGYAVARRAGGFLFNFMAGRGLIAGRIHKWVRDQVVARLDCISSVMGCQK